MYNEWTVLIVIIAVLIFLYNLVDRCRDGQETMAKLKNDHLQLKIKKMQEKKKGGQNEIHKTMGPC